MEHTRATHARHFKLICLSDAATVRKGDMRVLKLRFRGENKSELERKLDNCAPQQLCFTNNNLLKTGFSRVFGSASGLDFAAGTTEMEREARCIYAA